MKKNILKLQTKNLFHVLGKKKWAEFLDQTEEKFDFLQKIV